MNVPAFIDQPGEEEAGPEGRRLIALSELDVARDICDFTFILRSDIELSNFKFYLDLKAWTQDEM